MCMRSLETIVGSYLLLTIIAGSAALLAMYLYRVNESYSTHIRELADIHEYYANPPRLLLRYAEGEYRLIIEFYKRPKAVEVLGFNSESGALLFRIREDVGLGRRASIGLPLSAEAAPGICIAVIFDERAVFYYNPLNDPLLRDLTRGHCVDAGALRALANNSSEGLGGFVIFDIGYKLMGGSLPAGSSNLIEGLISRGPILCSPEYPDIYGGCNLYANMRPTSSVASEKFLAAITYDINSSTIWRFSGDFIVINVSDIYSKLRYPSPLIYVQALRLIRVREATTLRVEYFVNVTRPSPWSAYAVVAYVFPGDFNPSSLIALGAAGSSGYFSTPWLKRIVLDRGPLSSNSTELEAYVSPALYGLEEMCIAIGVELITNISGQDTLSFIRVEVR